MTADQEPNRLSPSDFLKHLLRFFLFKAAFKRLVLPRLFIFTPLFQYNIVILTNMFRLPQAAWQRVDSLNEGLQPFSAATFAHPIKALEAEVK